MGSTAVERARGSVRRLVEATPDRRDRVVDALRAVSIAVVVVWHWSLSITHRDDAGDLVNPNPIDVVPLGWLPTWVLQVMPVFFLVGGFANLAGWRSTVGEGEGARQFLRARARRLLAPPLVFVAVWAAGDTLAHLLIDGHRSVFVTATIVFVPLWFIGAYLWVVALVPVTARLHAAAPRRTLAGMAVIVVTADVLRFAGGLDAAGWVNTALVWVVVHQMGYVWHDGSLEGWSRRQAALVAVAGVAALTAVTSLPDLPRSMVGTGGEPSHMLPTTSLIAVLAVVQLAIVRLVGPRLARWLQRTGPWSVVVAVNAVIMTIFVWHMTALWLVVEAFEATGHTLGDEPTAAWWSARPLWVVAPALVLVPLVALFARVEVGGRTSSADAADGADDGTADDTATDADAGRT